MGGGGRVMVMIIKVNGPLAIGHGPVHGHGLQDTATALFANQSWGKAALARESRSAPFSGNRSRFKTLRLEVK